ncbi:alpha/beta family hydrolase [Methylobrevis pamukkalensis]|uniref:Alpha/beta hydrolase family protein n=1 Tax=Methylobrevis pamukkalensis TaxID=1439726 RepID=A0A1E3H0I4_9HYPH|nr:alpha/beta family hydrolase [Methylobrevis pamukkalensis]ODN69833.1 Alpha/beta hydrolase family protein [Methylobrevis pamukkalensis]
MARDDRFLVDRAYGPGPTLLLAHGAGLPMDAPLMTTFAGKVAAAGVTVVRFEFAYMAMRRAGARRPPPRGDRLIGEFRSALDAVREGLEGHAIDPAAPLLAGGKSLGGRVAAMLAGDAEAARSIAGVVCWGYPLRPPGKPASGRPDPRKQDDLRRAPLLACLRPMLVLQGSRDPFGSGADLRAEGLPDSVTVVEFADGDHHLKPRARSGESLDGHLDAAAARVAAFAATLAT